MNSRWRSFAVGLVALAFCLVLRPYSVAAEGDARTTLTLACGGDFLHLDPARAGDSESILANAQIYEGLVRLRDGSTRIEPCLAESWISSRDGRVWTFRLRRGVRFHDGLACDAAAVAASFRRQMAAIRDPDARLRQARTLFSHVAAVEVLNERTVRLRLALPVAALLSGLASPYAAIVSPAALTFEGGPDRHPAGTGPFRFVARRPGEIVLARNEKYWGGPARMERLLFLTVPSAAERFRLMQTGRTDVMTGISPSDLPLLEKTPGVRVLRTPGVNVAYVALNTRRGPFRHAAARRAVRLALDTSGIVRLAYGSLAEPARALLPLSLLDGAPHLETILPRLRPDPDAARRIFEREGLLRGRPLTLLVMDRPRPYMPEPLRVARAVRRSLAAAGLRVVVRKVPWARYMRVASKGEYDLCLLGWVADTPDPHETLRALLGWDELREGRGSNVTFWRSAAYRNLVERGEVTRNAAERMALYAQALRLVREEAPLVPLAHAQEFVAVRANVSGVVQQPIGAVLRLSKAVKR